MCKWPLTNLVLTMAIGICTREALIGVILGKNKDESLVKASLPENGRRLSMDKFNGAGVRRKCHHDVLK